MVKNLEGLVHIYFGDGKGKTTAAIGLGVRAALREYKVCMIQFLKGKNYSEENIPDYIDNFKIFKYGTKSFIKKPRKKDMDLAHSALKHAKEALQEYDLVILDEINYALNLKLIKKKDIIQLIKSKPSDVELILTGGKNIPKSIKNLADYISNIRCVKHPYKKGIQARKGIEY